MPLRRWRNRSNPSPFMGIKFLSNLSSLGLKLVIAGIVLFVIAAIVFATQIPSPEKLQNREIASATKIYDRNGELLYDIFQNQNRTPIKLSEIPESVKQATISIEDKNFYTEQGFSIT